MNKNKSFQHKIIYGGCMIVLLIAISLISRPATTAEDNPGGMLAQMRKEYHISDAELGKVDPASEAMRLSLLGLDGVAITFLWNNLNEYQKTEQYTLMEATARTISYLNPHLLKVWEFQSWNMSYNVSREFDNYKHRYLWVKRGIEYHMDGTEYNYNEPRMMNSIAHFFGNKFGIADEKVEYRELFPTDRLFHAKIQEHLDRSGADVVQDASGVVEGNPDNWLVARLWDLWATDTLDNERGSIGAMSPTIFYQYPAKRLMNFGEAIEKEGHISEKAKSAWGQAYNEWIEYGDHEMPSTYGIPIKLNDADRLNKEIAVDQKEFDDNYGKYVDVIYQEKFSKLPEETQGAIETDPDKRSDEQKSLAYEAERTLKVSEFEVVKYMRDNDIEGTLEASKLANKLDQEKFLRGVIDRQKDIVAFNYWRTRAESEMTDRNLEARQLVFDAHEAYKDANLVKSRELYEKAWEQWEAIYKDYPALREDSSADVLADSIKEYRSLLNQFDEDISPNFPLLDILKNNTDDFTEPTWNPEDEAAKEVPVEKPSGKEGETAEKKEETKPDEKPADEPMKGEAEAPEPMTSEVDKTEPMKEDPKSEGPMETKSEEAKPTEDMPEDKAETSLEESAEPKESEEPAEEKSDS
ncbi:hypothetical protein DTL21_22245 [Bremerella cremea]|uniref:IRE (Iron responsive element) n=1 Tax=Blastopirellula marina TaxID=124 RepID=A0A2S8FFR7_9BACT|nr:MULTISPECIES: hypothetical protein [Pirellulaceae]PQO30920.1 hypothetical protein C5Y83_22210 [Blastopirellula marina]RCS44067.1 hypothetical protein DTL21_22245 [Bremerella cremea]